jgi:hypothetical protein
MGEAFSVKIERENRKLDILNVHYWVTFFKKLFVSTISYELTFIGLQQILRHNTMKPANLMYVVWLRFAQASAAFIV